MKVNDDIQVSFSHKKEGQDAGTSCLVLYRGMTVGYARTHLYYKDRFDRNKGRKYAMKKALAGSTLSKADRTLVWEKYRNLTKNPRW